MIPIFSGIASPKEYELLETAGATHLLADQFDIRFIPEERQNVTLDCGAYKLSKRGLTVDVKLYIKVADSRAFVDRIAPDVIGDPAQTLKNWKLVRRCGVKFVPVFQWGAPPDHLKYYLDDSELVALGGLVTIFHEKETQEQKKLRERTLRELIKLCANFPQRFHLLGGHWLKALDRLKDTVRSFDSAKWISSAGKGRVIFTNRRTRPFLAVAPQKVIKENGVAIYAELNREQRAILNARNMQEYFTQAASAQAKAA